MLSFVWTVAWALFKKRSLGFYHMGKYNKTGVGAVLAASAM